MGFGVAGKTEHPPPLFVLEMYSFSFTRPGGAKKCTPPTPTGVHFCNSFVLVLPARRRRGSASDMVGSGRCVVRLFLAADGVVRAPSEFIFMRLLYHGFLAELGVAVFEYDRKRQEWTQTDRNGQKSWKNPFDRVGKSPRSKPEFHDKGAEGTGMAAKERKEREDG